MQFAYDCYLGGNSIPGHTHNLMNGVRQFIESESKAGGPRHLPWKLARLTYSSSRLVLEREGSPGLPLAGLAPLGANPSASLRTRGRLRNHSPTTNHQLLTISQP